MIRGFSFEKEKESYSSTHPYYNNWNSYKLSSLLCYKKLYDNASL